MALTADTSEPLLITGTPGVTDVTFRQLRQLTQAFGDGVMGASDMLVTAPGGMNVQVAAGYAMVTGDTITGPEGQHRYGIPLTAAKTLGTITAPSGATRRDSIVARVYDEGDAPGAGLNVGRVEYRVNPSESTTAEALPNGAELLAYCDVTVGAGAITSGMLTDMRKAARPMRQVLDDVQAFTASGTINPAGGRIVTFVGSSGQTLTLPKAVAGRSFEIMNIDTSDNVAIARAGTDTITDNRTASATSFNVPPGATAIVRCVADGVWIARYAGSVSKVGAFSCPGSTGALAVTGVGFRPKALHFTISHTTDASIAILGAGAVDDGLNYFARAILGQHGSAATRSADTTSAPIFAINSAGSTIMLATVTSLDADGFTLNFTNVNANLRIGYLAVA